ncbi:MAG: hypothetical protein HZA52_06970 [Planctomycetes bacterium]|nr:hypothetical protein [Planctomycetota bacterium]
MTVYFEHDAGGNYAALSRGAQRKIEKAMQDALHSLVDPKSASRWTAVSRDALNADGRWMRVEDETTSLRNLWLLMDRALQGIPTLVKNVSVTSDKSTPPTPICKWVTGDTHVDGIRCPLTLKTASKVAEGTAGSGGIAGTGDEAPTAAAENLEPWFLSGTADNEVEVRARVMAELSYTVQNPK